MKNYLTLLLLTFSFMGYSQTTPGEYTIKNVKINTKDSDFGTTFFGRDKVIFAAPKDNAVLTRTTWSGNNQAFLDLYIGKISEEGEIVNKQRVLGDVNNKYHEGVAAFTKDLKTVYFSANNYKENRKVKKDSTGMVNIQLYKADVLPNGEWRNIVKLPFNNDEFSTGHPALSLDDRKLYFVSDRPGSVGKTDIYVVDIFDDGSYSSPKNMGRRINTEEREMFPFISDENILYFSSNGHPGYGELDVFASKIFDNTVSEPINLEEPINSKKDDFAYIIDDTKHKGYFSSNRKGGKGDDDIYGFVASPPLHIECNQEIAGVVRDKDTQELLPGSTVVLEDLEGNEIFSVVADAKEASFSFEVPCNTSYKVVGMSEGYLREEIEVKTVNDIDVEPLEILLGLATELRVVDEKIMININTIYFDFDRWNIRPDAAKELDKVIAVMKDHPSMIIEAGSHTDSRATEVYNQVLSEKRAKATVDYIVGGGIDRSRITAKGYGEMQLVNNCSSFVKCSREQHQLNRRTEFVIVNDNDRFVSTDATLEDVMVGEDNLTKIKTGDVNNSYALPGNYRYYIIVASLNDKNRAQKSVNKFRKKGYEATVLPPDESGALRVSLGDYYDKEEALSNLYKIRTNIEKSAWLLKREAAPSSLQESKTIGVFDEEQVQKEEAHKKLPQSEIQNSDNRDTVFSGTVIKKDPKKKFIQIDPIFFDFDSWSISDSEIEQLDNIVQIMKENPALIIEAGAHTDAKNTESYNQILSNKRANSVVAYITSKGISHERIFGKGYGESRLVNHCKNYSECSESENQANRRIEFMIIKGNGYPKEEFIEKENGMFIHTNPIYFDYDKHDIRKDAAYELDRVVRILKDNPELRIEAGSHTDAQNTEAYNQVLSENRAKSVKQYLISKGIDPERILSKGYGEMKLTNKCKSFIPCTPEEHQANRRTEFRIVNM